MTRKSHSSIASIALLSAPMACGCAGAGPTDSTDSFSSIEPAANDPAASSRSSSGGAPSSAASSRGSGDRLDSVPVANLAGVHAVGNQIFDGDKAIRLLGVDHPGTEYSCVNGTGIFDPADGSGNNAATVTAMKAWGINAVRVPLNEDCWLSRNGVPPQASGAAYQSAIKAWVATLIDGGIYPILDLHWTENSGARATGQEPMPDAAHAVDFWTSVARAFAGEPRVILDLFNEPFPDSNTETTAAWQCWRDGGSCPGVAYPVAGMQAMLDAVRRAGANNLVLLGGIEYANDLSQWLAYAPTDPANNIGVSWHVYNNSNYTSNHTLAAAAGPVLAKYPIVATEIGDIHGPCDGAFIGTVMRFLDAPGEGIPAQSYLGWSWSTDNVPSFLGDYTGSPACDGAAFRAHLLAQQSH